MSDATDAIQTLRLQFSGQLPSRLQAIREQFQRLDAHDWKPDEAAVLHRLVHGLSGAAGSFGMHSVGDAARTLEARLKAIVENAAPPGPAQWGDIAKALERLDKIARITLKGKTPNLRPPRDGRAPPNLSPLVHLVEDDASQAQALREALEAHGFRVAVFNDLARFQAAGNQGERADAVVMDMVFPEGDHAGAEFIAARRAQNPNCPPVVFASVRDDIDARLSAYRAGASRYLTKPLDHGQLCQILDGLTERMPREPYRVLLVDDDCALLDMHAAVLREAGMVVETLADPRQALDRIHVFKPEVLVLDVYMPDINGPELAAILREQEAHANLPILFLSAETDMSKQLLALNLGGDDFLVKPVDHGHLAAAVAARARRTRQNDDMAVRLRQTLYEREREHLALNQHAIVSVTDAAGNITYVNDKFCEISGYGRQELIGQNHRIVKSGQHAPELYRQMWQTIAAGQVWQGELCNRRKDGGLYWVESTITPFLDADGIPYQYVSIRTDISQVKAAEQAVAAHKERLRRGQMFANIGTWDWNIRTGELFWTERIAPLFGYPEGDLETSYENFLAAIHPDDRQAVIDAVDASVEHGAPYEIEHRVVWPDGTVRWLLERGAVLRDADGKPMQMLGVVQDIDDRKRAEMALAVRERELREAQALARLGNWTADLVNGKLTWSDEIYRIFGHEPGSFAPSVDVFHAAVHPDDRTLVRESEKLAEQTGRHDVVHRIVRPDGTVRYVQELAQAETDASGRLVRLTGTVQDITERKLAELALAERERELREAQALARLGNWTADLVSGKLTWSDEVYTIFGRDRDTYAPDLPGYYRDIVYPDDVEQVRREEQAAYTSGRQNHIDHRFVRPDGSMGWVHVEGQAVHDDSGKPVRLSGTVQDITNQKQAEQALIAARDEADRANRAKSDFLSSMSHELRTPMNAILGFAQLLEYDDTLTQEQREGVYEIGKAGHHLLELINGVLDLAKIESGHIDLSLEPVEVCPIVDECLSLMATLAARRNIRLGHKGLEGAAVRADRTRLKQVLLNLLSNAIKYNRDGGSVRLEVRRQDTDRLRILVADTGPGIPAARMAELFQPFNRLDAEKSNIEGTGIGLTITRRIVEMMGGTVDVESEAGAGSTFWVDLPLESAPASIEGRAHTAAAADVATPEQSDDADRHTVLYVEDNPANLRLVAHILGRRPGIRLLTAHTAELGIELAQAHRPDLILLDINMPDMDGYQVFQVFQASPQLKSVPVIAITANAMPHDIERGKAAGFSDYLTKPLDVTTFLDSIDHSLAFGRSE